MEVDTRVGKSAEVGHDLVIAGAAAEIHAQVRAGDAGRVVEVDLAAAFTEVDVEALGHVEYAGQLVVDGVAAALAVDDDGRDAGARARAAVDGRGDGALAVVGDGNRVGGAVADDEQGRAA